ncbi:MAG TPA: LLM class flavin-dependent oxidoreductase [Conexibacter sp.]|jgi:probable F420-dependent oxidoreductase
MRYGVLFSMQDPPGSPIGHPALYAAAVEQTVLAEQQGYEWVNVTEHHVSADGYLPAIFALLGAMAAVTRTIRLSTGMLIITLHEPVRVAEEAAVVDILSGGRLTLGIAAGYRAVEFQAMSVDLDTRGPRFRESIEILDLAWSGEPFSYSGRVFDLPEVVVRPTPVQRPGIPLWLGGTNDAALRRAIRRGAPCFPGATDDLAVVTTRINRYHELCEQHEQQGTSDVVLPRLALVADTVEEARRRALPGIRAMFETYQSWGLPVDFGPALRDWSLLDELVIVGDEERVAEQVARYAELGVSDLMLQFAIPSLEPAVAAESQSRFPRA